MRVSAQAAADSEVLWLNVKKILTVCPSSCTFHTKLIRNLVALLATKNLFINHKLSFLTQRSTREKLLAYLYAESKKHVYDALSAMPGVTKVDVDLAAGKAKVVADKDIPQAEFAKVITAAGYELVG